MPSEPVKLWFASCMKMVSFVVAKNVSGASRSVENGFVGPPSTELEGPSAPGSPSTGGQTGRFREPPSPSARPEKFPTQLVQKCCPRPEHNKEKF